MAIKTVSPKSVETPFVFSHSIGTGEMRVLSRLDEYNYLVEIAIVRNGRNENNWAFENVDAHAHTFAGQPVLTAYVNGRVGDGHNMRERTGADGKKYYSFTDATAERIVGMISENPADIRIEERDGFRWVIAKAKLWRFYNKELVDKIAMQGRMSVSAEINSDESTKTMNGDIEVFNDWTGIGVTILGDGVAPAVPKAHIRALDASYGERFNEMKLKVASLQTSKGVKPHMAISKTLSAKLSTLFKEHGKVVTAQQGENGSVSVLLQLANGEYAGYTFADKESLAVVNPGLIDEVHFNANAGLKDGTQITLNLNEMLDEAGADNILKASRIAELQAQLSESQASVEKMRTQEQNRRITASEAKAKETLAKVNANKLEAEKFSEKLIEAILVKCTNGEFANMEDEEGCWNGEEAVCAEVMATCMAEQMKHDEKTMIAHQNEKNAPLPWEQHQPFTLERDDPLAAIKAKFDSM